jgi:Aspartyl protease
MPKKPSTTYIVVPLLREKSHHVSITATLAGRPARFIVDTGAGGTVIDAEAMARYGLTMSGASRRGGGVGSASMRLQYIAKHDLRVEQLDLSAIKLLSMDLAHVNAGLALAKVAPIVGVLGADILWAHGAMLDYAKGVMLLSSGPAARRAA